MNFKKLKNDIKIVKDADTIEEYNSRYPSPHNKVIYHWACPFEYDPDLSIIMAQRTCSKNKFARTLIELLGDIPEFINHYK